MKKRFVILALTLLILVVAVSPILAQGKPARAAGEITAIDNSLDQLTLKPRFHDPITVQSTADTEFWRKVPNDGLEVIGFDDLADEDQIYVHGSWDDETIIAEKIVVIPARSPVPFTKFGTISDLDPGSGIMTLDLRIGDELVVQTTAQTRFYRTAWRGRMDPIAFEDLAVGDLVKVHGDLEGANLNAEKVTLMPLIPVPQIRSRISGHIKAVDPAGTFELKLRRKGEITVNTEASTKFYRILRWGQLETISFDDLAVGDGVMLQGAWDDEEFDASKVIMKRGSGKHK